MKRTASHLATFAPLALAAALMTSMPILAAPLPAPITLSSGWQLGDAPAIDATGDLVSRPTFRSTAWHPAVVPGTVLTSLVAAGIYPEPTYGENLRPNIIPETLAHTPYWYRTTFIVPRTFAGKHIWLNFEGINYSAEVWVNGREAGTIRGAFLRGTFDLSTLVRPGAPAVLAVLVTPQPHPGIPHEHTIANGVGLNGGETAIDGPTFLSTIGWDWLPAIRDRDTGIWQKVTLSATGPVVLRDPQVTTTLPLPRTDTADVTIRTNLENLTALAQRGILRGSFNDIAFTYPVTVPPHSTLPVILDPATIPALHVLNPKLWWPNGYGPQNLSSLHLAFELRQTISDSRDISFGIRTITYAVPDSENLTISVNGVRVFIRGGDWGLDEALKRIPRERLEAQIRMHQVANLNMIRNWVGQSTGEDFYELCDKYGILLWDEFFQPNPSDGPDPVDLDTYFANVREKVLRFRNHPSIAVWCARNEGYPPKGVDDRIHTLMAELDPQRLYQSNSADGRGVKSGGPYLWRTPREYYTFYEAFKTEIGSMSVPTLESIQGMMPRKDWEIVNDDWAQHDFAKGASGGDKYRDLIDRRYGPVLNLADFVRKAQLANFEAFRAMYEGRNAKLFAPTTGVITWMSNPAQPSFVWQLYHHDLEANSALFAVRSAGEPIHIQLNEANGRVQVVNNQPVALTGGSAQLAIYNLDGTKACDQVFPFSASASSVATLDPVVCPATLSAVHFYGLTLKDAAGTELSRNFYWRALPAAPDDLTPLNQLAPITLDTTVTRRDSGGRCFLLLTLHNPGTQVALMTHLQLHRQTSGERILPAYYTDNYISLAPNETRTLSIEAAIPDLKGEMPLIAVDGWNTTVTPSTTPDAAIAPNINAQVAHWPTTHLPTIP